MRSNHVVFVIFHLFIVAALICLGICFIALPFTTQFRVYLAGLLMEKKWLFVKIGAFCSLFGIALSSALYFFHRKRYLKIKMGATKVLVDENVIEEYVKRYWKDLYPHLEIASEIHLSSGKKLEILSHLPKIPPHDKQKLLERVEDELTVLFAKRLGYEKEFILTLVDN